MCSYVLFKIERKKSQREEGKRKNGTQRQQKNVAKKPESQRKWGCAWLCILTGCESDVVSLPFWWRASLASCQPSREPNDSFDPIRTGAKSTLCSLRAGTCQLTTRPPWIRPYVPSCLAQWAPRSPAATKHNRMWENTLLSQGWLETFCMRQICEMCSKCAIMFKVTMLLLVHHDNMLSANTPTSALE